MGSFTVYFDGQFWAGLATRDRDGTIEVARVVFGSEPSDRELFLWACDHFHELEYKAVGAELTSVLKDRACGNPKRRQREAQRALRDSATRTRAQAAWSAAMEAEQGIRSFEARAKRREIEERKYQLRIEKRKQARRGK